MQDFPDLRFSRFAYAAFARASGMSVAAMQRVSPKLPFNRDIIGQIQTVLSLRMRQWPLSAYYAGRGPREVGKLKAEFSRKLIEKKEQSLIQDLSKK